MLQKEHRRSWSQCLNLASCSINLAAFYGTRAIFRRIADDHNHIINSPNCHITAFLSVRLNIVYNRLRSSLVTTVKKNVWCFHDEANIIKL